MMILLYLITPILGGLKNYVKYKQIDLVLFIRTPIIYFFINSILQYNSVWKTLIYERWYFFIYKILLSIYRNDYHNKKDKYIRKYGLKYS